MNFIEIVKIIFGTTFILILFMGICIGEYLYKLVIDRQTNKSSLLNIQNKKSINEYLNLPKENSKKALEWFENNSQEKYIESFDHLKLHYYVIKNRIPTNKWVIIAHGYNRSAVYHSLNALNFYNMGFNILVSDARGHGKSEGSYIGMGYKDRLDILSYIYEIIGTSGNNQKEPEIILYGCSMGAATILMALGEKLPNNVKAAISDCAYTSAWAELSYQLKKILKMPAFPILNFMSLMTKLHAGYFLENANAKKKLKKSKTPVLFIHGGIDTLVPTKMTDQNYKAANSPKEKLIIKNAGHAQSSKVDPDLYWHTIFNFISKYID